MITIKNKKLLNLEDSVLWCIDRINDHYNRDRVLADFGIRVVGQFETAAELEGVVGEEYGDAYLIGTTEPYSFYVWTRANPPTHEEDYWLDIGPIAIQGPTGPVPVLSSDGTNIISTNPETGEATVVVALSAIRGVRGSSMRAFIGATEDQVPYSSDPIEGDSAVNTNGGQTWRYINGSWTRVGNLRGPQGVQGPQGIQGPQGERGETGPQGLRGDVGGLVNVRGMLTNIDQLPDPATLNNLTAAYLVGPSNNLYIQIGDTPETATWANTGPFNAATLVTVQGVGQNLWDADTKLDKITSSATRPRVYCIDANGNQYINDFTSGAVQGSLPFRDTSKSFQAGETGVVPRGPLYVTNKEYVDSVKSRYYKYFITVGWDGGSSSYAFKIFLTAEYNISSSILTYKVLRTITTRTSTYTQRAYPVSGWFRRSGTTEKVPVTHIRFSSNGNLMLYDFEDNLLVSDPNSNGSVLANIEEVRLPNVQAF